MNYDSRYQRMGLVRVLLHQFRPIRSLLPPLVITPAFLTSDFTQASYLRHCMSFYCGLAVASPLLSMVVDPPPSAPSDLPTSFGLLLFFPLSWTASQSLYWGHPSSFYPSSFYPSSFYPSSCSCISLNPVVLTAYVVLSVSPSQDLFRRYIRIHNFSCNFVDVCFGPKANKWMCLYVHARLEREPKQK